MRLCDSGADADLNCAALYTKQCAHCDWPEPKRATPDDVYCNSATSTMAAPLLLTGGLVSCAAALRGCRTSLACLFYARATVFQSYHGNDMMYEMKRKLEPKPLLTQRIFNLTHHIGMVLEEPAFDDAVNYTSRMAVPGKMVKWE